MREVVGYVQGGGEDRGRGVVSEARPWGQKTLCYSMSMVH
jgi:hypothetical protein